MPEASKPVIPICPRCGYDLGGTVASWRSEGDGASCPTEGVCSECGYAHLWRDILNPTYQRLAGFYEHALTRRERITWGWRTTLWLIFPWVFWGKVKLHHTMRPLRALRLAAWMFILFTLTHATIVVVKFGTAWSGDFNKNLGRFRSAFLEPLMVRDPVWRGWSMSAQGITLHGLIRFLILVFAPTMFALAMTAIIVWVLPETRKRTKLRPVHAWRAAAYAPVAIGLSMLASSVIACAEMASHYLYRLTRIGPILRPSFEQIEVIRDVLTLLPFIWFMAFWWSAILRGWRLQHGVATSLLLTIASGTAVALVLTILYFFLCVLLDMGLLQMPL